MAKRFTETELNNIIKDYNNGNGLKPYQLAKKYDRLSGTIIYKLKDSKIVVHYVEKDTKTKLKPLLKASRK